ncbi:MAG: DNA polymerase I [Candidatus Riflebacteria bacterium]|nr:DNA polymerase I [Candidatus Riflebacteria bacterium]
MREALSGPERLAVAVLSEPASSGGATLLGVALTRAEPRGPVFYLPVGHRYLCCPDQLPLSTVVPGLGDLLAARPLIGHDLKSTVKALHPLVLALCHDTMLASYLLNPGRRNHSLAELAAEHLGLQIPVADGPGSDPEQRPVADAAARLARELDVVLSLERLFDDRLAQAGLTKLFAQVEMPLIPVLDGMERAGILVDPEVLAALGQELATELAALEGKIHLLCGETFNVNSPAQLSRILFEKLKCPVIRRTKTGYSTDSDVLLSLEHDHKVEVARHVNEYRHLAKLKGTYVDALPRLISPTTGRLHTTFNQVVTATGRLSSVDPNLQNIPVRTPVGMRIRRAFHAPPGHLLLSADYSQIELRILAHLADSGFLKAAFARDDDIHRRTAARMFGMAEDQVTPDVRSRAKAINFGILYGMSAYGLSREVGISQDEARVFMDQYFAQFPEVRTYIDQQLKRARENGFVTTLTGRRRYLPQIQSTNGNERSFAERTAVNTPVQGSAADLIKIAMLAVHRRLADGRFRARMLLQIHDELVFEVPEEEAGPLSDLVKIEMERAMTLAVNIRVDLKAGRSWADLK